MAVIETQFRLHAFKDIVKAQVLTTALPKVQIDNLLAQGQYVERVEVTEVTTNFNPSPGVNVPDEQPGQVRLLVRGAIHITDAATVNATPHLVAPAIVQTAPVELYLVLSISAEGLDYRLVGMRLGLTPVQDLPAIAGTIELNAGDLPVRKATLILSEALDLLTLRSATRDDDNLDTPVADGLGDGDFSMFVPGQAFADQMADLFITELRAAAAEPDSGISVVGGGAGVWYGDEGRASVVVDLSAIDALPLNFNLPFTMAASTTFVVKRAPGTVPNFYMDVDTTVTWSAGNTELNLVTFVGFFGYFQKKLSEGMRGKLKPPDGQVQTGQTANSVTFHLFRDIPAPEADTFRAVIHDAHLTGAGLVARGKVQPFLDVSATWTFTESTWQTEGDCQTKNFRRVRHPAQVSVVGKHPHHQIRPLANPTVTRDPTRANVNRKAGWHVAAVRYSQAGAVPVTFDVIYELPGSVHEKDPVDAPIAIIYTNVGVRRVDLAVVSEGVPPEALDGPARNRALAELLSRCMAISDRWGMGVFNLDWLVDPPDLDLGRPALREWTVSATDVTEVTGVEVVAVSPDRGTRLLARLEVSDGRFFGQVVTAADETIEVRTGVPMTGPVPRVSQRWIVPFSADRERGPVEALIPRTRSSGASTVAVRYDGQVITGVAGPYVPANRIVLTQT